jgi:cysteine sulfinate desulfinase/cysteine desulfurase-like protein
MIADGRRPKGHKIGFTSEAIQRQYGMTGPDFGQLLDDVFVPVGQPVPASTLSDARVEAEIAFELSAPLRGPGVTVADVVAATRVVRAAIEVIDSRVGAMRANAVDSIADNAGAGLVVLGEVEMSPLALDLADIAIRGAALRDTAIDILRERLPAGIIVSGNTERLWNTLAILLPGADSRKLVAALDRGGIEASTGSACSSGKEGSSVVVSALGASAEELKRVVRVSGGWQTSAADWQALAAAFDEVFDELNRGGRPR